MHMFCQSAKMALAVGNLDHLQYHIAIKEAIFILISCFNEFGAMAT